MYSSMASAGIILPWSCVIPDHVTESVQSSSPTVVSILNNSTAAFRLILNDISVHSRLSEIFHSCICHLKGLDCCHDFYTLHPISNQNNFDEDELWNRHVSVSRLAQEENLACQVSYSVKHEVFDYCISSFLSLPCATHVSLKFRKKDDE